jgi:hypothetical protein
VKFLMLLYSADYVDSYEPAPSELAEVGRWCEDLNARGVRLTGGALRPAGQAVSVQWRDGEVLRTDGPFAETKEFTGGFDILNCSDLDEAIAVAARHPAAAYGRIELREIWTG